MGCPKGGASAGPQGVPGHRAPAGNWEENEDGKVCRAAHTAVGGLHLSEGGVCECRMRELGGFL